VPVSALILVTDDDEDLLWLARNLLEGEGFDWQFASEFRARFDSLARLIVMTAAENASSRAQEIGADGWLSKPFGLHELISTVRVHLECAPPTPAS
jgi:DNA-binding response OmpR family regulator